MANEKRCTNCGAPESTTSPGCYWSYPMAHGAHSFSTEPPAVPARADEPHDGWKPVCVVHELALPCHRCAEAQAVLDALDRTVPPSASPEPKRCKPNDHVFLNEFGQDHTPPSGTRCECGGVAYFSGSSDIQPSSPERERAQGTPVDLPWSVENWKCGQWYEDERPWANIVTPAGNHIARKLKREYAERNVAAVNLAESRR